MPSGLPVQYEAFQTGQYDHLSYKTQVFVRHFIQTTWNSCESGTIEPQGDLFAHEGQWHRDNTADETHARTLDRHNDGGYLQDIKYKRRFVDKKKKP